MKSLMNILAYDPGNEMTAWVIFDGQKILAHDYCPNCEAFSPITSAVHKIDLVAIEMIASYGMAVGATVFETAVMVGELKRQAEMDRYPVTRIKRHDVKMHLCHSARAKDGNIRQALIDRFGPQGTKKNPGALYGITGDKLAALAVAVTVYDTIVEPKNA